MDVDEWYGGLDADTQAALDRYIEANSGGLVRALEREKEQRTALEQQAKELTQSAEREQQYATLSSELASKQQYLAFMAAAAKVDDLPGKNLATAFKLAHLDGLITDEGVNWDGMRQNHSYLFVQQDKKVAGNAGNGVGQKPQPKKDMNDLIRYGR